MFGYQQCHSKAVLQVTGKKTKEAGKAGKTKDYAVSLLSKKTKGHALLCCLNKKNT